MGGDAASVATYSRRGRRVGPDGALLEEAGGGTIPRWQSEVLRLAWADDDAFYTGYGDEPRAAHPHISDLLLVQPDCFVGITDNDIRRIDDFLAR